MKKRIFAVLMAVFICLSMFVSASATSSHISDPDYFLSDDEIVELNNEADYIYNTYGCYVVFSIVNSSDEEYVIDIAETAYNNATSAEYGIALAHNVETKKMAIYVTDSAKAVFNDTVVDTLCEVYNSNESYFGGVLAYIKSTEEFLKNGNGAAVASTEGTSDTEFTPVERTLPLVVDNADLLTDSEEADLEAKLNDLTEEYKTEVAVLTVTDLEEKTPQAYADDFYDYNGYGYGDNDDGVLVLYKPGEEGERELYITTHGTAMDALTDGDIDTILYAMKDYCVSEDYVGAFNIYVEKCNELLAPPAVHWFWIPVCIAVGFVLSLIITGIMTASLKSVRSQSSAREYVRQNSLYLTGQQDIFLYSNVTKTEIRSDDDDSSTHTSSSGRTHGGGGMSF